MTESSGTLLYRWSGTQLTVLLVHPSGNYNRHAPWGIPKGLPQPGESLEAAARRETEEETGIAPGELTPLGSVEYRSGRKRVHCFAGEVSRDVVPRCADWEIDAAEFVAFEEARSRIHADQAGLLDQLRATLNKRCQEPFIDASEACG